MDQAPTIEAQSESATRARRALTRRLIDVVGMPETLVSVQERRVAADLLFDILRDGDADLRRRAAQRFAHLNQGPKNVLRMLARDEIDIARTILEDCKSLDAVDLLSVIRTSGPEHRLLIAHRPDASAVVAEALVAHGETAVIEALLRNPEAKLSDDSVERIVDLSRAQPKFAPLLLKRQEMRPANAFLMFWWVGHDERVHILRRFAVERAILLETAADLFRAAAEEHWSDPLVLRTLQLIERRQRDRVMQAESLHENLERAIETAVLDLTTERLDEISLLSGVRPATGAMIFKDHAGEALAVFCKATGLKRPYYELLWRTLRGAEAPRRMAELEAGAFAFDILSPPKAQTVLRYWDWAIGGSSSLDTVSIRPSEADEDGAFLASLASPDLRVA
ncbi:MAG: DUF2336 domain-containing protein [Caulobacterales bacterium]